MNPKENGFLCGRKIEFFCTESEESWGYEHKQNDTFAVLHPEKEYEKPGQPLYVVFHSAGHDIYSVLFCMRFPGNHDIYHCPPDMYALILDCRENTGDWWWGGIDAHGNGDRNRAGTSMQPVEKRVIDTIKWTIGKYSIDENRVYGIGNSMGGSGVLGIGIPHGDIFAAIKANVPAGVRHAADRAALDTVPPEGFFIPDPPITIDYSAQNDSWSEGHEILYDGMKEKRYPLLGFWGAFGHANDNAVIEKENDLIHAFDIFSVRKDAAYPVFTNASTDDTIPWPNDTDSKASGQVNAFFRWENLYDESDGFSMRIRLLRQEEWNSRIVFPKESTADVTVRRIQRFHLNSGEAFRWFYGKETGIGYADENGHPCIHSITIYTEGLELRLEKY